MNQLERQQLRGKVMVVVKKDKIAKAIKDRGQYLWGTWLDLKNNWGEDCDDGGLFNR